MSHTKGPWTLIANHFHPYLNIQSASREHYIGSINAPEYEKGNTMTNEEFNANARLIVNAPEMLEVLEFLSKEIRSGEFVKHSADAIRKLRNVIGKVKGEL